MNIAASLYGYYHTRIKYGSSWEKMVPVIQQRDNWSLDRWKDYQNDRLMFLLNRAVTKIPYYRRLHECGRFPVEEVKSIDDLSILPILEKDVVRLNPRDFIADDCNPSKMIREQTSGTTGKPVLTFWTSTTYQQLFAIFEYRLRRWNGVKYGDNWCMIGGQLVVSQKRERPPFWIWNHPCRQLYMSNYHLAPQFLDHYLDEIKARKILYMLGFCSSMDVLATHALEQNRTDITFDFAIGNAEPYLIHQRDRIKRAFQCETRDSYGSSEGVTHAYECAYGNLHLSPDVGITEFIGQNGEAVPSGEAGELVCTGLLNPDNILIRYRLGDWAIAGEPDRQCECGRSMPIIKKVEGRTADMIITPDGRRIGLIDPVFRGNLRIKEAQIKQVEAEEFVICCVPSAGFDNSDVSLILKRFQDRVGSVNVRIELVDMIPRASNGKFKFVINECYQSLVKPEGPKLRGEFIKPGASI
jgi:phenylacetate-CoA ligase